MFSVSQSANYNGILSAKFQRRTLLNHTNIAGAGACRLYTMEFSLN